MITEKEALRILKNNLEDNYTITELTFDLPNMYVFSYIDSKKAHGEAFDEYAVMKDTGKVIRDGRIISDEMDKLSDEDFDKCKKKIQIAQIS